MSQLHGYFDSAQTFNSKDYISYSQISLFLEGDELYFTKYGEGRRKPPTAAMIEGKNQHLNILEHDKFLKNIHVMRYPDFKTKEAREWRDGLYRTVPDCIILSPDEELEYAKVYNSVMSHRIAGDLISKSMKEKHGYARDPITGRTLYSRPDLKTSHGYIGDLKFVRSIDEAAFNAQQFFEGWYVQLSFYNAVDGFVYGHHKPDNAVYIAIESSYPYRVRVYTHTEYSEMGDIKWRKAVDTLDSYLREDPTISKKEKWKRETNQVIQLKPKYGFMSDPDFAHLINIGG